LLFILSQTSDGPDLEISRSENLRGPDRGFSLQLRGADHGVVFSDFEPDGDFASHLVAMAQVLDGSVSPIGLLAGGFGSADATPGGILVTTLSAECVLRQ